MVRVLPADEAEPLEWLAFEQAGVLTTSQACRLLTEGAVRGMVRSGCWRSLCRGILLTGNGRLTRDQQLWVAVLATGPRAVLAGVTAAAEAGVRGLPPEPLHVLVPADRRVRSLPRRLPIDMPGIVVHRTSVLPEAHLQLARPPRTTTARAVVDGASWARSSREAQLILASACQQRRVLPEEVEAVLAVLPRAPRRGLLRRTVADIAGGAQALSELDFLALCRRHRLPRPDLQERRVDQSGRARWLDAYWREWRLHVEVDGAHHMEVRHWVADMQRQNDVWTSGDRILRFPAWLVRTHPAEVAESLRRALLAAGWCPAN
ncbi:endonuclease domain-containing protein [Micromonospora chaiyaphumensis]|uniref:Transcriptional regulator, AbiEi antitoxin, Type IV TA system n=1 Tax=Micromonospora chaiyaphumensis TaxID=307119 RepID=A0A1C4Z6L2_9ACTN|nr:endonuclease domain-containing protein [Micromonospora chaiyaphumensis]SCF28628.1 Transcriptional regulator, AbiEi antitoxin, Type IV TA system [Micromonospora chaiyaphumensis]